MNALPPKIVALVRQLRRTPRRVLFVDYDGTLVSFADTPHLAGPDDTLFALLSALARVDGTSVHLVTGRPRRNVDQWFGHFPVALWAEHGLWYRSAPGDVWHMTSVVETTWMMVTRALFEASMARIAGSFIEEKDASLAWHYRMANQPLAGREARALERRLVEVLRGRPIDVLAAEKVIEVRHQAANKGRVIHSVAAREDPAAVLVAIGDDRSDEDMFTALSPSGVGIHVGRGPTAARYRLANARAVRAFLRAVISDE